jgi:hypothetical protein
VTDAGWLKEEMSAVQTSDLERRFRMIKSPGKSFFGEVAVPGAVRTRLKPVDSKELSPGDALPNGLGHAGSS